MLKRFMLITVLLITVLLMTISIAIVQEGTTDDCIPATGEPIRIGAVFPEGSLISRRIVEPYQGAQAMLEAYNACGGVDGRPIEWVYIPANDRDEATEAAQTLIETENVPLIVGSGALAVREALEEVTAVNNVVLWEVSQALSGTSEWAFATRPTNAQLGQLAVEFVNDAVQEALALEALRVAVISENRPRGQQVASGILDALARPPQLEVTYTDDLYGTYTIAETIRDEAMNVVMLGTFDMDASRLWYAMRDEDTNPAAWIQVGSSGYQNEFCDLYGNNDGLISVSAIGAVSEIYRQALNTAVYAQFERIYLREYSEMPSELAMLSASGMDMLLRYVFPNVDGEFTAEAIRQAIIEADVAPLSGLMGEGLSIDLETGVNRHPGIVVQQRQQGQFCTVWPEAIATCSMPVQPFPTWRERAILEENFVCRDSV